MLFSFDIPHYFLSFFLTLAVLLFFSSPDAIYDTPGSSCISSRNPGSFIGEWCLEPET